MKVFQSEQNKYIEMNVIAKYKYIGKNTSDLKYGKIYNCVGKDGLNLRIVDESGEDYLYIKDYFEIIKKEKV